ncbi:MAG: hypothetical protein HQ538_00885 [Parcubacteria group bacterium]|nr:hypothetical protein [Parcubacteria group bacterium]
MKNKYMKYNKLNLIRFGIIGGILGGVIAIIGFWILSPSTDSLFLFVLLRMVIGAVVAMLVGPLLASGLFNKK